MFDKGSLSRAFEDTEAGLLGERKLIKKVGEHMSVARQNNNAKGPTVYQLTHTHTMHPKEYAAWPAAPYGNADKMRLETIFYQF
jgi:hypothetical protein